MRLVRKCNSIAGLLLQPPGVFSIAVNPGETAQVKGHGSQEFILAVKQFFMSLQEQVSESTTKTVLEKLLPNTRYTVTVVPVYAEGDGPSLSDSGKTSEYLRLQPHGPVTARSLPP